MLCCHWLQSIAQSNYLRQHLDHLMMSPRCSLQLTAEEQQVRLHSISSGLIHACNCYCISGLYGPPWGAYSPSWLCNYYNYMYIFIFTTFIALCICRHVHVMCIHLFIRLRRLCCFALPWFLWVAQLVEQHS